MQKEEIYNISINVNNEFDFIKEIKIPNKIKKITGILPYVCLNYNDCSNNGNSDGYFCFLDLFYKNNSLLLRYPVSIAFPYVWKDGYYQDDEGLFFFTKKINNIIPYDSSLKIELNSFLKIHYKKIDLPVYKNDLINYNEPITLNLLIRYIR